MAAFLHDKPKAELQIVLSSPEDGGRDYTNKVPFVVVFNLLSQRLHVNHGLSREAALNLLNEKLFLKRISFSDGRTKWPSGNPRFNHAKLWMVDDKVFYVGSENVYPSVKRFGVELHGSLQEFGIIAEPTAAAFQMIHGTYFGPLYENAVRTKATSADIRW